jgi:hypothetical protein
MSLTTSRYSETNSRSATKKTTRLYWDQKVNYGIWKSATGPYSESHKYIVSHWRTEWVGVHFNPMLCDLRKSTAFWKIPRHCPLVTVRATCMWKWVWRAGGMILTEENGSTRRKPVKRHFTHHKYHMDWPGIKPESPRRKSDDLTAWHMSRPETRSLT